MCEIALTIPDEALSVLADSREAAGAELRMLAAVKLFELKRLSSGAASRLADISRVEFLKRLSKYGVPVFDMTEQGLKTALKNRDEPFGDGQVRPKAR